MPFTNPIASPLLERLRNVFHQNADLIAIEGAGTTLSYRQLDVWSAEVAATLTDAGVSAGQLVPLFMPRSVALVVAQVAVLRLGATYVPIDLASPPARQHAMLRTLEPLVAVIDGSTPAPDLPQHLRLVTLDSSKNVPCGVPMDRHWHRLATDSAAYCMFTSGSTGIPKAVMVPNDGILRLVCDADYADFVVGARWSFLSSPAFDAATLEVWGALLNGGCCVVQEDTSPSLDVLADFLVDKRVDNAWLTASLFNAIVEDRPDALSGLQQLLVGGERLSPPHVKQFLSACPKVRLINGYGPTENTTFTLCHTISSADTENPSGIPIGRPIHGTSVRVGEGSQSAEQGELLASGRGLALGYLNDPELTVAKFIELDGLCWYRTGDLVHRRADGVFEFMGRADRQVKIQGHRIELDEVEHALATCPGVGSVAVLVRGESAETRYLAACYSGSGAPPPAQDAVAAHLGKRLPLAAIPRLMLRLARMPMNLNGKIDRDALGAWLDEGSPNDGVLSDESTSLPGCPPDPASFVARLLDSIRLHAAREAIEGSSEALTYAEFDRRSECLAARLQLVGVKPGDFVPMFLQRSPLLVVAMAAIVRCGAAYVPIDLASPAARLARIMTVLEPRTVVAFGSLPLDALPDCTVFDCEGLADLTPLHSVPWPTMHPDAPLYAMFTSGSTGVPKGVVVSGRGLVALLCGGDLAEFPADARWSQLTSPAFDISNLEIWGALLNGACCVIQEAPLPSLSDLAGFLVSRGITHAQMSTALFNAMVDLQLPALSGLRQFITGGERASPPHMRKFVQANPDIRLINAYGPTETTVWSLCHTVSLEDSSNQAGIPIGHAIRGTQLRIDTPSGDSNQGELLIGGEGLALGYINAIEETARKFIILNGQRWYRTGDLVRQRPDGLYEFLGRADRQVKLQGQRIEIDEVELALAACPGVGEVAVFLRGDTAESHHLVACFSGLGGPAPDEETIIAFLTERLPQAAVPKRLVSLDRLPLNLNGKVDRQALVALLEHGQCDHPVEVHWQSEAERQLADIWQQCLPNARIHRSANFMRIGGTSLLALVVSAQVRRQFGRDVSPIDVLRIAVLSEQATHMEAAPKVDPPEAFRSAEADEFPLTLAQRSMLAASQLDESGCAYLVHTALRFTTQPDTNQLRRAFERLAARHVLLRTSVRLGGEQSRARILESLAPEWWCTRPPLVEVATDLDWPESVLDVIDRPMSIGTQGLMRVDYWPVSDGSALLVWTVHHIAIDEASVERCLFELDEMLRGNALAPVYGSPIAFAALEKAWTDHEALQQWPPTLIDALRGVPTVVDRAPGPGREIALALHPTLGSQLEIACARWGVTPFTPLLGAFGLALQDTFGTPYRFVSTPFSRRIEPELMEPVGYLLDVRLIEAGARPGETPDEMLGRLVQAQAHHQRPTFLPHAALTKAVAAIDAMVVPHVNAFGFTWRLDPARDVKLGQVSARLLRVPQQGARFGICLHASSVDGALNCSIEAVESAFVEGRVEALRLAFISRLEQLCAISSLPAASLADIPANGSGVVALDSESELALRSAWARWTVPSGNAVTVASNFLQSGGSSLAAMRMISQLLRQHGLRVDVGPFLARPTFGNLCTLAAEPRTRGVAGCVWEGPQRASRVVLLIPGMGGHALGLFALAEKLREAMGDGVAVAIVDLEAQLQGAPREQPLSYVVQRTLQLIKEIGAQRLAGIVGFSLGSLLALHVTRELHVSVVKVCLIDGYAPRAMRSTRWLRAECRLGRFLHPARATGTALAEAHAALPDLIAEGQSNPLLAPVWQQLQHELATEPAGAPNAEVHLIQALQSVQVSGILWRRATNGFDPRAYAKWHGHAIDALHLELPRALASETADLLATCLARPLAK